LVRSGSFQSQSQGNSHNSGQAQTSFGGGGQQQGSGQFGQASLFVPGTTNDWWPSSLRFPNSTGAQNGVRYAYFAQARRLAIEVNGRVIVYDTLDHQIGGFGQQQSYGGSLSFNSQYGLIDVASLPVIDGVAPYVAPPAQMFNEPANANNSNSASSGNQHDVFATIERLADLRAKGIVSDDEFATKKAELLSRL
jgi:Short C-terminal domain